MGNPLNLSFDEVADLYDTIRPGYPSQLIDAVDMSLRETPGRILEIGCGTGQATVSFAQRGHGILALEPGPRLSILAASNLADFPKVHIEKTTFEDWPVQKGQFDLVMSATAFHWIAPEVRYVKAAQSLKAQGSLALFWNTEADDESPFAQQLQTIYSRYMPSNQSHPYVTHHPAGRDAQQNTKLSKWGHEIEQSGLFGEVSRTLYPWSKWYSTEQYLQLLETYSDHRTLPHEDKRRLFDAIADLLTQNGGGREKPYLAVLYLSRRL